MVSKLGEAVGFLDKFGLFDVLLPFLLIFTMVFAILERTLIFGVEERGDHKSSRKNLNALFAFSIAFFTIASAKAVSTINRMIGPVMILMLCLILFLMLISIFEKDDKKYFDVKGAKVMFAVAILIIIILIFLSSIETGSGGTWLEYFWDLVSSNTDGGVVSAIILILIIGAMVYFIGGSSAPAKDKEAGK